MQDKPRVVSGPLSTLLAVPESPLPLDARNPCSDEWPITGRNIVQEIPSYAMFTASPPRQPSGDEPRPPNPSRSNRKSRVRDAAVGTVRFP